MITSACRVTAHHEGDYHLEFAVHPGWSHTAKSLVNFVLAIMRRAGMKGMVIAKAYDYQGAVVEALEEAGLERVGNFSLMARDHWLRAKTPKPISLKRTVSGLGAIGKPAINIPRTMGRGVAPGIIIAHIPLPNSRPSTWQRRDRSTFWPGN